MTTRPWILLLALFVLALAGSGCGAVEQPAEQEVAAIYAAVIRQIYTVDDTFGGTLQPPRLYIVGTTDDSAGEPGVEAENRAVITTPVREEVTSLLAGLPAEIVWVESRDEVPLEAEGDLVSGEGAIINLGNVAPQRDGSVHVPASIYVANLAAGGQTYVVEEVDGVWMVTGTTGAQWIS